MTPPDSTAHLERGVWRGELGRLDVAAYAAIAQTPTPRLDGVFRGVSAAANHSKLWLGIAGVLATTGGASGRRAAADGVASIGVSSAVVNILLKRLAARRRPERAAYDVPIARQVAMPVSTSFPSGHAASAFAFATAVAADLPLAAAPLNVAAAVVAYSRVHTGVHYPGDVIVGALAGGALASAVVGFPRAVGRRLHRRAA